jgi:ribA/ribD-fused uncharacterized protein
MDPYVPPVFQPFKKTRVVLALEATPIEKEGDLTALGETAFRDSEGQGPTSRIRGTAAKEIQAVSGPRMFAKKGDKKAAVEGFVLPPALSGLAGLEKRQRRTAAPAARKIYSRMDVMSRDLQAAEIGKLSESLKNLAKSLLDVETTDPYIVKDIDAFVPISRRGFGNFLFNKYGPIFPRGSQKALDVATCAGKGQEGVKEVKIYHYQAFIREYLRYESPYRGLLVYHGLGSGKTCSAIAAAEALFGTRGSKIVVMTPFSLRDNFISEINFCGFKHFRLQNHWASLSLMPGSNPDPEMVKLFAKNVYGIPDSYISRLTKGRAALNKIWIPDFEQAPNFDSLSPEDKDEIKTQLKVTIENRITFINYNGITARELKTMVCSKPETFDNAVIVVDEIHNLVRLIQGTLESYFGVRPRSKAPLEILSVDRQKLPYCGMTKGYMRGYLFYRLFMDAKNSKIIGLSGTPLINFPEELGILSNILHGPIYKIAFDVTLEAGRDVIPLIEQEVLLNENLDTIHPTLSEGSAQIVITRLPEQFVKIFSESGEIVGIHRRDPDKKIPRLDEIWVDLLAKLKSLNIKIRGPAETKAQELLPSWDTPFRGAFLQEDGIKLKNVSVLKKRLRGLVSYYRGIQGDVMPKVTRDEIVGVPLTGYSLKIYNKLRNEEIQIEMKKPKATGSAGDAVWAEIGEIASMKSASNYRMSSRQACNFAFPEGVARPRPNNLEEQDAETGRDRDVIVDADVEDGVAGKDDDDAKSVGDDEDAKVEAMAAVGVKAAPAILGTKEAKAKYQAALKSAKERLRSMGKTHLQLDGPPERNLAKFSPKFSAILTNLNKLPGSSLVYSNFLAMEGIGIFGICMEANGYEPIEIVPGADGKLKFSDRTAKSLLKGPKNPEKRYIEFTGTGSKEQRGAAVDVFNARLDKLSPALQKVLKDGGWSNNFDGGLCRAFCITSAGAEGLSLKCVRGVHIMEPYWNTVRTQQVKGRAVRICSHMDLPKDQQNVEIFTYCTIIPDEAVLAQAVDKTLEHNDAYSANDAMALGVPVPKAVEAGAEISRDMFFKVEEKAAAPVNEGAQATIDGPIEFFHKLANDYRGFSNFAPSPMSINGKIYPSVEHYFQAMKFPDDLGWQEAIRVAPVPDKARQLGSQADKIVRADWETQKESIMITGLRAKFQQNSGLLQQLKETGSRPLIEASTDPYWGKGRTGKGKNRIGKLLEQVREELREFVPEPAAEAAAPTEDFFEGEDEEFANETEVAPPMAPPGTAPTITRKVLKTKGPVPAAPAPPAPPAPAAAPAAAAPPDVLGIDTTVQGGGAPGDDRLIILTSDQKVLLISLRKERVIGSLQTLMKSVAVDCRMNYDDNKDGTYKCMGLGDSIGDFAYHPDLQKDIEETEAKFKTGELKEEEEVVAQAVDEAPKAPPRKMIKIGGEKYYFQVREDESGSPLGYILYKKEDPELSSPFGFIKMNPETGAPRGAIVPV